MAHFVKLDENNIVIDGAVIANAALDPDNEEQSGIEFLNNLYGTNDNWKQTSYNGNFRFNYAYGVGYIYDEVRDGFIPPKCHDEATLNNNCRWDCTNAEHNTLVK
jgi:hypothetical protein